MGGSIAAAHVSPRGTIGQAVRGCYDPAMRLDLHLLTNAALELDPAERLELASLLIESVEQGADPSWQASWSEEIRRRSASADARAERGKPWAEVRARLLRDFSEK